ncbi:MULTISPECIES: M15 family metallopeptidase [Terrabacteria group]|uniref:M15 family metallopeptidase n=1 Tax=Bacillati TaxID=1783272 RepID=UPI001C6DDA35|nr:MULTISPECIES: M15 family metallopeptidase [Terrabacteria group]MBW9212856.1 M15 family metallopeptidase [Trueperella sp. zg.1013]
MKKKPKRHIRKSFLFLCALFVVGISYLILHPSLEKNQRLEKLGYTKKQIQVLSQEKKVDEVIQKSINSVVLRQAIDTNTFYPAYFSLYKAHYQDKAIQAKDILLYQRLKDKGYEEDQLENLFKRASFEELSPLLVFDYQWDETSYLKDVEKNRSKNIDGKFQLSHSYRKKYKISKEIKNPQVDTLVNVNHYYSSHYIPKDLTGIPTSYAANQQKMSKEAAEAVVEWVQKSIENNTNFFVTNAYLDYHSQEKLYLKNGERVDKAGYSERQSGLQMKAVITYAKHEEKALPWLKESAREYGFILRYPAGKEMITGHSSSNLIFRYVGKDLAKQIQDSSLTFDEYSELYLQPWIDKTNKPSDTIIHQAKP